MLHHKSRLALIAGGAVLLTISQAKAAEFYTPFQPGVSTGVAAGALPPPGLYGNIDVYELSGTLKNNSGQNVPGVKLSGSDVTPQLLYVPGWKFLGANYAMMLTQPFNFNTIKVAGGATGPSSFTGGGMFNTILTPEILSWALGGGNFVSEGASFVLPDGDFRHIGTTESTDSISNNYFTFEPNFAYSYLGGGWNITFNNTLDFNTTDNTTHYHSGDTYYLDGTVEHAFGPVSAGLIGNYIQQFTGDTKNGNPAPNTASAGTGNEFFHASIGPILSYNLGKATITVRYLNGLAGKNGGNPSFFHVGVSFLIF